jgi:hypothetical protein
LKLTDLEPKWLTPDVFSFKCPHCKLVKLLCKKIPLSFKEQVRLVNPAPEDEYDFPVDFVPMNAECAWKFSGDDFATLTVTPSIDASNSGHWHGYITKGQIV